MVDTCVSVAIEPRKLLWKELQYYLSAYELQIINLKLLNHEPTILPLGTLN